MTLPSARTLALVELAAAGLTVVSLKFLAAPYGRHGRPGWGPLLRARFGWIVMESPSLLLFPALLVALGGPANGHGIAAAGLFSFHYVYRTVVYPVLAKGRPMPWSVALSGFSFNILNASVQATALAAGGAPGAPVGVSVLGLVLFACGFIGHVHSDHVLRTLRAPGEEGYKVPDRGLHRFVAAPNYLSEIVQWCGFALLSGTLGGLAFAVFTAANLGPRAADHLRWYRERFPDYPPSRKALIPGMW